MSYARFGRIIRPVILGGVIGLIVGCGGSAAASPSSSAPVTPPAGSTAPAPGGAAASTDPGRSTAGEPGGSTDNGPIGGDIGDRSKGSVKAQITGGLTSSIDLPFGAALGTFGINGPKTAYLPFTDETAGTLFLTITADSQLVIAYAGPNSVGLTNGPNPCELKIDALDASQAKGSFTCKGATLIQGETLGSADISGTFEAHK